MTGLSMEQSLNSLEAQIRELRQKIKLGQALDRLEMNNDFKLLIKEAYFQDEASKITLQIGSPVGLSDALLFEKLKGISALNRFLSTIKDDALTARNDLTNAEDQRTELLGI